ncbi:MAG: hypothetical protein JRN19_07175 [Nitrososphaerota archaeon]|nr:hypothetical protein [Nitrososphaerota archaeon]MDG7048162.1 hypothetical protein [Nitrososphaerota archaeon]MDG7052210.1 hypothetical protein [Nitrososphaerota archaeon]
MANDSIWKRLISSLDPRHYNIERWSYTLHRITGVVLILFLIAHMVEIFHISLGPESWAATLALLGRLGPLENIGLWIIAGCVFYHGANGLRLLLNQVFGLLLGKPRMPVYPYTPTSLGKNQRIAIWTITAVVSGIWIWAGLYILAGLGIV